jgi:hypothetical protein
VAPWCCIPNGCHREAARIFVQVERVRVERLQAITYEGALAEGVEGLVTSADPDHVVGTVGEVYRHRFRVLWDSIYARRGLGWDRDPWVWVTSFKRVEVDRG